MGPWTGREPKTPSSRLGALRLLPLSERCFLPGARLEVDGGAEGPWLGWGVRVSPEDALVRWGGGVGDASYAAGGASLRRNIPNSLLKTGEIIGRPPSAGVARLLWESAKGRESGSSSRRGAEGYRGYHVISV